MQKKMKLVILDRDGVINADSPDYIRNPDQWHALAGSLEAIAKLHQLGYTIAVATNQSGLGRGYYDQATLRKIHDKMCQQVQSAGGRIDHIVFCPHHPDANCHCRKPQPGLLQQLAKHYNCKLQGIPFIGDSRRDLQAAIAVGAQPILVRTGKGMTTEQALEFTCPIYDDLNQAVQALVTQDN